MKAVARHGTRDARVEEVPDPGIREPVARQAVAASRRLRISDAEGEPTPPLETARR